jgi:hypothetical protein
VPLACYHIPILLSEVLDPSEVARGVVTL